MAGGMSLWQHSTLKFGTSWRAAATTVAATVGADAWTGEWRIPLDAAGNLYIPDIFTNSIRKVDTHGIITTVAGNGGLGFAGDGGQAKSATLAGPLGVAVDTGGVVSGPVNSHRYPPAFDLNLYLERRFTLRGYRLALRGGVDMAFPRASSPTVS